MLCTLKTATNHIRNRCSALREKIVDMKIIIIYLIILSIFISSGCNQKKEKSEIDSIDKILQADFPKHFPKNTVDAMVLREIIKGYVVTEKKESNLISYIKDNLHNELYSKDSVLHNKILKRLDKDEKLRKDCEYIIKVLSCNEQLQSKHFVVYNLNSKVDTQLVNLYDKQYDMLKSVFNSLETEKLNLVLDTNLNYWRAFPIWDVKYGLLQRYINGNPHELVHHFFTKYSDVPFFHEPMAFLYGDYRNDTAKFYNDFGKNKEQLTNDEYVNAKNVWHFPAIVILKRNDKLSFWLFTSNLMQKYGIDKFIQFAGITTWDKNDEDFEKNFQRVYNISLEEFEKKYIISQLK